MAQGLQAQTLKLDSQGSSPIFTFSCEKQGKSPSLCASLASTVSGNNSSYLKGCWEGKVNAVNVKC
jgi:hypothetical protein